MSYRLDPPCDLGNLRIAALCETSVSAHGDAQRCFFTATKRPVALLIRSGDRIEAFGPNGAKLKLEKLEKRCPRLREEMLGGG